MFYTLVMTHKIGSIHGFRTDEELHEFAVDQTSFTEEEKAERAKDGNTYGPPVVFVFSAEDFDRVFENNFESPVAVYLRGERYDCVKRS
jgi:hypothetical protein